MKIFILTVFLSLLPFILFSQVIGGSGICLTNSQPIFSKDTFDCPIVYDVVNENLYVYNDGWSIFTAAPVDSLFLRIGDNNAVLINQNNGINDTLYFDSTYPYELPDFLPSTQSFLTVDETGTGGYTNYVEPTYGEIAFDSTNSPISKTILSTPTHLTQGDTIYGENPLGENTALTSDVLFVTGSISSLNKDFLISYDICFEVDSYNGGAVALEILPVINSTPLYNNAGKQTIFGSEGSQIYRLHGSGIGRISPINNFIFMQAQAIPSGTVDITIYSIRLSTILINQVED
jgi:hypothetical protein